MDRRVVEGKKGDLRPDVGEDPLDLLSLLAVRERGEPYEGGGYLGV